MKWSNKNTAKAFVETRVYSKRGERRMQIADWRRERQDIRSPSIERAKMGREGRGGQGRGENGFK